MTEMSEKMLDDALEALARDAAAASPRPSPDLLARVLADAGQIAAARPVVEAAKADGTARAAATPAKSSLADLFFGWASGAAAAMVLALAVGIGVGMEMEPGAMPMTDADESVQIVAEVLWADEEIL